MSDSFYAELPPLRDFDALTQPEAFALVPADWWIVITDIEGSTKAIEAGRYKDVNLLGAASIAALKNAAGGQPFPFVFGGDGASAAIPEQWRQAAARELAALQALAEQQFAMSLRVGMVSVAEVLQAGHRTLVAKLQLQGKQNIALFRGGGLREAENLVKADPSKYAVAPHGESGPPLTQLSCRWQPIAAKHGTVLSILVSCVQGDPDVLFERMLGEMRTIFGGEITNASPVNQAGMTYKPLAAMARDDAKMQSSRWSLSYATRLVHSAVASLLFGLRLARLMPRLKRYEDATSLHSDYRKFDDMLRMVLDCTGDQRDAILALLQRDFASGAIVFGVHQSSHALMTCYLESFADGGHIHFIDGSDGGYAMAAKQLKAQLADRK